MSLPKNVIPERVRKTAYDFQLYIKKEGTTPLSMKWNFSFTNFGAMSRNEVVAALRAAADHFESIDRGEAQRLWGTTLPLKFRPRPLELN